MTNNEKRNISLNYLIINKDVFEEMRKDEKTNVDVLNFYHYFDELNRKWMTMGNENLLLKEYYVTDYEKIDNEELK